MKVTVMLTKGLSVCGVITGTENLKCVASSSLFVSCKSRDPRSNLKNSPCVSHKNASPSGLNLFSAQL